MTQFDPSNHQWRQIQSALLDQKAEINRAIREYPLPITACDEQFNLLLEKRSAITRELGRFNRLCGERTNEMIDQAALDEFIQSSLFLTEP